MPHLSKDETQKEIRSVGADDPANMSRRVADAQEIFLKSGWPSEPVRPKLKDLLAAAHERNKKAAIAADIERQKVR